MSYFLLTVCQAPRLVQRAYCGQPDARTAKSARCDCGGDRGLDALQ